MGKAVKEKTGPKKVPSQSQQFIDAAHIADADEDESRWEARLKAVAKPPTKPARAKSQRSQ